MKHATLYRRWRPRAFSQVVGQDPVVQTLRRAIESDRVSHAYLFSGPRGTGKTSTAKVLAMGLNCERGPTPEPCGQCGSCGAIVNNSSMDVLEMDAASNRGIDEIRELRDKVNLAPAAGRVKVYIIDEVHMLTTEAFNALLKMLEEPPEHVIFVLATTEKHKVLPTIISRCQSFDFRRPSVETLSEKLAEIAGAENIEVEPEALTVIARQGRGSFRDAEGLLDQLSSFAEGPVTAQMVRELLGSVGSEVLLETAAALYERRAADALRIVDRLSNEGKDLGQFVGELIGHLRNVMLLPHAPETALAEVGAEERGPLEEQAENIPAAEVVRLVEALGDASRRIRRGGEPKLELELTFLKLTRDYTEPPVGALLSRLETLERVVAHGERAAAPAPEPAPETVETATPHGDEPPEEAAPGGSGSGVADDGKDGTSPEPELEWNAVLEDLEARKQRSSATIFKEASVAAFDGETLELVFPGEHDSLGDLANDSRYQEPLQAVLTERLGRKPRLSVRVGGESKSGPAGAGGTSDLETDTGTTSRDDRSRSVAPDDLSSSEPEGVGEMGGPGEGADEGDGSETVGGSSAPEIGDGDDIIRDEREVFEMARERFGSSGANGGS